MVTRCEPWKYQRKSTLVDGLVLFIIDVCDSCIVDNKFVVLEPFSFSLTRTVIWDVKGSWRIPSVDRQTFISTCTENLVNGFHSSEQSGHYRKMQIRHGCSS